MLIIDGHQDIASNAIYATGKDIAKRYSLHQGRAKSPGFCVNNNVDLPRLREGGVKFIFSSVFGYDEQSVKELSDANSHGYNFEKLADVKAGREGALEMFNYYNDILQRLSEQIELVKNKSDYQRLKNSDKIGLIIHSEGVDYFQSVDDLDYFFDLGLRSLALTWRNKNIFAGGNNTEAGLTEQGKKLLEKALQKGVIIDLAHSNQKTFFEAAEILQKPFAVSHTNCAAVFANSRNISDEQIELVAKKGGVVGVSAITEHLGGSTMADYIKHILYIVQLVGPDYVGFGTDFDGMVDPEDKFIAGFEDVSYFPNVLKALAETGLSSADIEKIAYKNWQRLILSNLPN